MHADVYAICKRENENILKLLFTGNAVIAYSSSSDASSTCQLTRRFALVIFTYLNCIFTYLFKYNFYFYERVGSDVNLQEYT